VGALRVEGLLPLSSWEVTLNTREVWATPPWSLTVGVDVAAIFP